MSTFETRLIGQAEDLPDLLLAFDMTATRLDATPAGGPITEVKNRAPGSLHALSGNDQLLTPWWNAKAGPIVGTTAVPYDAAAFFGAGGLSFTAAGQALRVVSTEAPTLPPGSFTILAVTKLVNPGHGQVYYDAGGLVQMNVSDTAFGNRLTYGHSGGVVDTGVTPGVNLVHVDVLRLDAGANSAAWFRDGALIYLGAYADSAFGGGNISIGDSGVGARYMDGAVGRLLVYGRALSSAEISLITELESRRLNSPLFVGTFQHAPIGLGTFVDPPDGPTPSRINPVPGHPERYYRIRKNPYSFVDVLALPIADGTVDSSATFVPHFVEWPFMATSGPPMIFVGPTDPSGVCRLRLTDTGRYQFVLYKPGGGAFGVHFNLEP